MVPFLCHWRKKCHEIAEWHNNIFLLSQISCGIKAREARYLGFPWFLSLQKKGGTTTSCLDTLRSGPLCKRPTLMRRKASAPVIRRLRGSASGALEDHPLHTVKDQEQGLSSSREPGENTRLICTWTSFF